MSALLDVNLLLACGWQTHPAHSQALVWLDGATEFFTCPLVELGFFRVSMGPAFRAQFQDTHRVLTAIKSRPSARSIAVDFDVMHLPAISTYNDVTDAYLVALAKSHSLSLATLDMTLLSKSWAAGIAFNPLES